MNNPLKCNKRLRLKWVFRRDTIQGFFRIARILWERGEGPGFGRGYSAKLSFALNSRVFRWFERDATHDWCVTLFGLRVHYCRSYGGRFA